MLRSVSGVGTLGSPNNPDADCGGSVIWDEGANVMVGSEETLMSDFHIRKRAWGLVVTEAERALTFGKKENRRKTKKIFPDRQILAGTKKTII